MFRFLYEMKRKAFAEALKGAIEKIEPEKGDILVVRLPPDIVPKENKDHMMALFQKKGVQAILIDGRDARLTSEVLKQPCATCGQQTSCNGLDAKAPMRVDLGPD